MKLLGCILFATDFSKSSNNVLENAIELAKIFNSKLNIVHILPDSIKGKRINELLNEAALNRLDSINEKIKSKGVQTGNPLLENGPYFEKIIQTADSIDANVILIGAGEKSESDVFQLGTNAENIIRKSSKPVWVVKNGKPLKIDKVLCPIDYSIESNRALRNAITIARRLNAELMILHIIQAEYSGPLKLKLDSDEQNEDKLSKHTQKLNKFLKKFNLERLGVTKEILEGDPATEILKAISRNGTDLLIMGTTGKTGLTRMLMGSVTEKVIREVPCSFVTLKSKDVIKLQIETEIRDIESHFNVALQLVKDGFFKESIKEFEICLNINDMHVPSLNGLEKVYELLGDTDSANLYKNLAKEVMSWMWDRKIEAEIRKYRSF